ncbi:peptide deformylase [Streptomyces sp. NPDC021096]|uniref:peptide deformylase n=1 Tax=Streptomyces sp. NPDC021096 TaxID=3154792 RepID=UPI0033D4265D
MTAVRPSEQMCDLGVVQYGAPVLAEATRPLDLPDGKDTAEQTIETLFAAVERIARVHPFTKGMGIAAPQTGIARAAAVVQPTDPTAAPIAQVNRASPPAPRRRTSSTRGACPSSTSAASSPAP